MRFERFSGLQQRFQAGKNRWPFIGAGCVAGVIVGPIVMCHGHFSGVGLGHEFNRCAGGLFILAHRQRVLKDSWRLKPQNRSADVRHVFAIGSRTDPCELAARLKVRLKLGSGEDDAVRFSRYESIPDYLGSGGDVKDIRKWCLLCRDCSRLFRAIAPQTKSRLPGSGRYP